MSMTSLAAEAASAATRNAKIIFESIYRVEYSIGTNRVRSSLLSHVSAVL